MKKSIDLEYSYIDLNASTISINPSQSPQRPVSKKNGVDDRSPRISKQDSFTVLTESMLQGFEGSHGSDRKSDASSNKSRASLLLRPSRSRRAPEKASLLTETQHRERLFEIFKDWTRQNTLPSVLCSPCVSGLYEMSSEQLQRAVKEFKQLHNYRSTSCTSLVDPSFVSNAVRQLAEQHERQELQYDVSALSEDSERLQQEIRLLEQKREITAQLMKAQHREVVKLRQQLQNDGSSGSDVLFLDDALDKAESDVSRKLQLLTATYCEEKLWGSRVTLAPLFDDIQTFPTNISTTTSTAPTTSPTSSSTPSSPLPNTSKPDDSYDDSFLATAKKLFARHRKKSDDPTTSTPDTSACVSTTSAEYAVINGHRVSVVPIPKILLNWEEINTAHSLYCSHLLALHRTLPPSTSSSSSSDVLRCGEVVRCLPRLTYAIQRLLSLSRLSIYSSLLKDLQESRRVRQELRLLPLSDRALLSLRCSGREGSGEEVWQETLHLEGGVTMTWHNGLLYREDRGGGSGSGSGGGDVKLVRESATSHYSRAVLAVVVAAVVIQLEYLEHSLSDVTGRLSDAACVAVIGDVIHRLFPSSLTLQTIALCVLLDLPIGHEPRHFLPPPLSPPRSQSLGDVTPGDWLVEVSEQRHSSSFAEEIDWRLFRTRRDNDRPPDERKVEEVAEVRIQRILYAILSFGRLLPITPTSEPETSTNDNHVDDVTALRFLSRLYVESIRYIGLTSSKSSAML